MTPLLAVVSANPLPPYCAAIPAMSRKFSSLARMGVVIACCAKACAIASQNTAGVAPSRMRRMAAPRGRDAAGSRAAACSLFHASSRNMIREALRLWRVAVSGDDDGAQDVQLACSNNTYEGLTHHRR